MPRFARGGELACATTSLPVEPHCGRPSIAEFYGELRELTREIYPGWDLSDPELKRRCDTGEKQRLRGREQCLSVGTYVFDREEKRVRFITRRRARDLLRVVACDEHTVLRPN